MNYNNPIIKTDSYKFTQWPQYPPNTTDIFSYVEARGSKIANVSEVTFSGLQPKIQDLLMTRITMADVEEAKLFVDAHIGPNIFHYEGWKYIVQKHGGYIPVEIKAVPEGTTVPTGNLLMSIHSLDPKCFWAVSYVETALLQGEWYATTVATLSRHIKKVIKAHLEDTADDPAGELQWKLHDFGFRGVSSDQSAGYGGWGHLINFFGTDTTEAILHAMRYYDAGMCGFSIVASEHSTITSWGREREYEAYANMVQKFIIDRGVKLMACVIDSYDVFNAIKLWALPQSDTGPFAGKSLLDVAKENGARVVLRPDSGDPVTLPIDVVAKLMDIVGYTVNTKGYKVLPDHVRVIQGDGIDHEDVDAILTQMEHQLLSASNIGFGMGGGLLQKVNRDTFKFAMKACAAEINGNIVDVYKDPITDPGKKSKRGVMNLFKDNDGVFSTRRVDEISFDGMRYHDEKGTTLYPATQIVYSSYHGRTQTNFINFEQVRANAAL